MLNKGNQRKKQNMWKEGNNEVRSKSNMYYQKGVYWQNSFFQEGGQPFIS